jgi:hypothetical protein
MESTPLQKALDTVDALAAEDQRVLIELVSRRLGEETRIEISRNAADTLEAVRAGRASIGTFEDLREDLLGDA